MYEAQTGGHSGQHTSPAQASRRPPVDDSTILVCTQDHEASASALCEVAVNTLHARAESASAAADNKDTKRNKPREGRRRSMTQTTLSLSINKEPGFTICRVCDILYNPLNEKDRKEHARRHAAYVSRSKGKTA